MVKTITALLTLLLAIATYASNPPCEEITINMLELPKTRYHLKRLFNLTPHQIGDIQKRILEKPNVTQERSERIFESMKVSIWGQAMNKVSPFRRWNHYLIIKAMVANDFSYARLKRIALSAPWQLSVHEKRALYIMAREKISGNLFNGDLSLAKHMIDKVMSMIIQNKDYKRWKLGKITIPPRFDHQTSWFNRYIMGQDYFISGLIDVIKYFVIPYIALDLLINLDEESEQEEKFYNERIDIISIDREIKLTPEEIDWLTKKINFE